MEVSLRTEILNNIINISTFNFNPLSAFRLKDIRLKLGCELLVHETVTSTPHVTVRFRSETVTRGSSATGVVY